MPTTWCKGLWLEGAHVRRLRAARQRTLLAARMALSNPFVETVSPPPMLLDAYLTVECHRPPRDGRCGGTLGGGKRRAEPDGGLGAFLVVVLSSVPDALGLPTRAAAVAYNICPRHHLCSDWLAYIRAVFRTTARTEAGARLACIRHVPGTSALRLAFAGPSTAYAL
jgi:hypothetical protein